MNPLPENSVVLQDHPVEDHHDYATHQPVDEKTGAKRKTMATRCQESKEANIRRLRKCPADGPAEKKCPAKPRVMPSKMISITSISRGRDRKLPSGRPRRSRKLQGCNGLVEGQKKRVTGGLTDAKMSHSLA